MGQQRRLRTSSSVFCSGLTWWCWTGPVSGPPPPPSCCCCRGRLSWTWAPAAPDPTTAWSTDRPTETRRQSRLNIPPRLVNEHRKPAVKVSTHRLGSEHRPAQCILGVLLTHDGTLSSTSCQRLFLTPYLHKAAVKFVFSQGGFPRLFVGDRPVVFVVLGRLLQLDPVLCSNNRSSSCD